jgi:hypothetical protein
MCLAARGLPGPAQVLADWAAVDELAQRDQIEGPGRSNGLPCVGAGRQLSAPGPNHGSLDSHEESAGVPGAGRSSECGVPSHRVGLVRPVAGDRPTELLDEQRVPLDVAHRCRSSQDNRHRSAPKGDLSGHRIRHCALECRAAPAVRRRPGCLPADTASRRSLTERRLKVRVDFGRCLANVVRTSPAAESLGPDARPFAVSVCVAHSSCS